MNTQPEALRLADWLETDIPPNDTTTCADVAAELRRLHEVNQMLVEALEITVPYLPAKTATLSEVEDALAKAKEQA
jgi:hypothetical protein